MILPQKSHTFTSTAISQMRQPQRCAPIPGSGCGALYIMGRMSRSPLRQKCIASVGSHFWEMLSGTLGSTMPPALSSKQYRPSHCVVGPFNFRPLRTLAFTSSGFVGDLIILCVPCCHPGQPCRWEVAHSWHGWWEVAHSCETRWQRREHRQKRTLLLPSVPEPHTKNGWFLISLLLGCHWRPLLCSGAGSVHLPQLTASTVLPKPF